MCIDILRCRNRKKRYVICPFVVHEHVLETIMTRVSSCMYIMGSVLDVVLKYMMLGSNTDRVPAEYRQSTVPADQFPSYLHSHGHSQT